MIHEKQQQKKLRRSRLLLPVIIPSKFYIIIYSWNRVLIYSKKIIVSRNSTLVHFLNLAALQVSAINSVTLYIFSKPCRWNLHSLFFFFFFCWSFYDCFLAKPNKQIEIKKKKEKEKLGFLNSVMLPAGNQTEMRDKKGFFNSVASGSGTILRPLHDLLHRRWTIKWIMSLFISIFACYFYYYFVNFVGVLDVLIHVRFYSRIMIEVNGNLGVW